MRHTIIPVPLSQLAMEQAWVRVPHIHHESMPKPMPQRTKMEPFRTRLRRGDRPVKRWKRIVRLREAIVKRETVVSWDVR